MLPALLSAMLVYEVTLQAKGYNRSIYCVVNLLLTNVLCQNNPAVAKMDEKLLALNIDVCVTV